MGLAVRDLLQEDLGLRSDEGAVPGAAATHAQRRQAVVSRELERGLEQAPGRRPVVGAHGLRGDDLALPVEQRDGYQALEEAGVPPHGEGAAEFFRLAGLQHDRRWM